MTSKSSQRLTVSLLLLVVMVQWASRHLLPLLPDPDGSFAWQANDVLRAVGMSATLAICVTLTPWRMLRIKCLLAAFCGYYLSDIALCSLWYYYGFPSPRAILIVQGITFAVSGAFYWLRSYSMPSDPLMHGYLYSVRRIPANPQDFLISMLGLYGPDGGYSLYLNGYLYKFSAGRLVRRRVLSLPAISYHVTRGCRADDALVSRLDSMIGMRWTPKENCLTTLGRIWRKHSGRAY